MSERWSKGDPVNISDLIKITPLANEVSHLAEELDMSSGHVMWILSRMVSAGEMVNADMKALDLLEDLCIAGDEPENWEEAGYEALSDELSQAQQRVDVSISGAGRFHEIGFHAGVDDKADIRHFFDLVLDMLDKFE